MPEKFTIEQKEQIVIESLTATNVAELCRRHGVSVAQFLRWRERFLEGARNGLGESSKGNEYQKGIDDLKRLAGYQTLAIAALKKSTGEEIMMAVSELKEDMPIARISKTLEIPRTTIYSRKRIE